VIAITVGIDDVHAVGDADRGRANDHQNNAKVSRCKVGGGVLLLLSGSPFEMDILLSRTVRHSNLRLARGMGKHTLERKCDLIPCYGLDFLAGSLLLIPPVSYVLSKC
jgi:hypothetical protein